MSNGKYDPFTAELVIFTKEILNGKLDFCAMTVRDPNHHCSIKMEDIFSSQIFTYDYHLNDLSWCTRSVCHHIDASPPLVLLFHYLDLVIKAFNLFIAYISKMIVSECFQFTSVQFSTSLWKLTVIHKFICGPSGMLTSLRPGKDQRIYLKQSFSLSIAIRNCFINPRFISKAILHVH